MHNIIRERLELIMEHARTILTRLDHISNADDFMATETGILYLDAIITRLQAIGENIKKIEKLQPYFIQEKLFIDPTPVIRFRDLSSHHYDIINHRIIYSICKEEIPLLQKAILSFLASNSADY